jgi:ribonucleoside-triphosphate reductase
MARTLRVRLRDGREAAFDPGRVVEAIQRAGRAAGVEDRPLAEELADVVTLFLERRHAGEPPSVDEIDDMIEKVLLETGHIGPAKAFIVDRERRQQRAAPPAAAPAAALFPEGAVMVDSPGRAAASPWDRQKIADALVLEARVDPAVAEAVAQAVEARILAAGIGRVSTRLIRELVSAELFTRGLPRPLADQGVVGVPRYDLRAILADGGHRGADGVGRALERATLRQYALEEVLSPAVSRAHVDGVLHLHGLEDPLRLHALHLAPAGVLDHGAWFPGGPAATPPPRDPRDLTEALPALCTVWGRLVSGALDLGDLAGTYAALAPAADPTAEAPRIVRALALAAAQLADVGTELSINLGAPPAGTDGREADEPGRLFPTGAASATHAAWTGALGTAWAAAAAGPLAPWLPRCTVHVADRTFAHPPLLDALRRLGRRARVGRGITFAFARDAEALQLEDRYRSRARDAAELRAGGGPRLAVVQAITLNVARAALEAGPGDLDACCAELERAITLAFGAARERREFLRRMAGHRSAPLAHWAAPDPEGRPAVDLDRGHLLLGAVGIDAAVAACCGPAPRTDAFLRTAARLASFIWFRAAEEARAQGFGCSWDEDVPAAVGARLRALDVERFGRAVPPGAYGQGLVLDGSDPGALLEAIRRRASLHALVDPRVTIRHLPAEGEARDVVFDMVCEVHQHTHAVFLRFA